MQADCYRVPTHTTTPPIMAGFLSWPPERGLDGCREIPAGTPVIVDVWLRDERDPTGWCLAHALVGDEIVYTYASRQHLERIEQEN